MDTEKVFTYEGSSLGTTNHVRITPLWPTDGGQDGAIYKDLLFRFGSRGECTVYRLPGVEKVASFILDGTDRIAMHSNAVSFGKAFLTAGDEFPLLYTNVYNNYSKETDRLEGTLGVYRIFREGDGFKSTLLQIIRVGFTKDPLWCSESVEDVRPYGNFIVDTDRNELVAFTMRDASKKTRIFTFPVPEFTEGEWSERFEAPVVTLRPEDILQMFDSDYSVYLQGACYHDGKLFSVEGFSDPGHPAKLQVFDLRAKKKYAELDLLRYGMRIEPELIAPYGDGFLYSDNYGRTYLLHFE